MRIRRMLCALFLTVAAVTTAAMVPSTAQAAGTVQYWAFINTGDVADAGTDDYVWIQINGSRGSSGWLGYLDTPNFNDFERGCFSDFTFYLTDLGTITSVDVYVKPSGIGPDWYLDGIVLHAFDASGAKVGGYWFPNYRWLSGEGQVHLPAAA